MKKSNINTQPNIVSLKRKVSRLKSKIKSLEERESSLLKIPEEQRTTLQNLELAEIKLDRGNINIKISTYEYSIKELERWYASIESTNQPS